MSPNPKRWFRYGIAGLAILGATVLAGCAGQGAARPNVPDESLLDPANQALSQALDANAESFAPRIIDSARRRMTIARDILFSAAEADRPLTDDETARVKTLAAQARLDARAARVKTQAGAVQTQLDRLQNDSGQAPSNADTSSLSSSAVTGSNRQTLGGSS